MREIPFSSFGISVGHYTDKEAKTGCTVALFPEGVSAGVSVVGGAPGTRETDLLRPENLIHKVHGVFLTGGSAFGLDVATGIVKFLEELGAGFETGFAKVPIVTGAVLYDLGFGSSQVRPDAPMGYEACKNASRDLLLTGSVGAGAGATVAKILGESGIDKGGIGYYGIQKDHLKVGAIVAVNAFGSIVDRGEVVAGSSTLEFPLTLPFSGENTTIGMVFSNGRFDKSRLTKIAQMSQDGLARSIMPSHTFNDGDTLFALGLDQVEADPNLVGILSAYVVEKAVIQGVRAAKKQAL